MTTYSEVSGARRFGVEVMTSVLDHETEIQIACEILARAVLALFC